MIESRKQAESLLRDALAAELDEMLAANSFTRRSNSLVYSRKCEAGKQVLRMNLAYKPRYSPGATGHITPLVTVEFPQVTQVALDMVGGNAWLLANAPEFTISQPIDIAIPNENLIQWYTYEPETFSECARSIRSSLETWIVPFLNQYISVASITSAYEKHDNRILMQRRFFIYVAAAFVLLGQPESAMKTLEDQLGKAGSRRDYAKAFEYVESLLV